MRWLKVLRAFLARIDFVLSNSTFKGHRLKVIARFWGEEYYEESERNGSGRRAIEKK